MPQHRALPQMPEEWYQAPRYTIEDWGYGSPCWIWQRGAKNFHHGQASIYNRETKRHETVLAHRLFYQWKHGLIQDLTLEVDHLCFVPRCVNPDHLELVTQQENLRRRRSIGPPTRPDALADLSSADVADIRTKRLSTRKFAALYGVNHRTVGRIQNDPNYVARRP
jgi:hypothetical protein